MRYRPLANTGMSVSVISLALVDMPGRMRPADWVSLIYGAMENGVNAFEVVGSHPAIIEGVAEALSSVERRLLFVGWRLGSSLSPNGAITRDFSPGGLGLSLESALARTGLGYLDAVLLDDPRTEELSPQALEVLKAARDDGKARMLGVAGQHDAIDAYISMGAFDMICTPFSLISGWKERLRLKAAIERDMAVLGYGYEPEIFAHGPTEPQSKPSIWGARARPLAGVGTYAFLHNTAGWSSEELCLAYALTEPSLASIEITSDRVDRIEALAAIPERELPTGAAAQIEMARFAAAPPAAKARRA
jgi:aryl-alcohol dehydrogenase-like predicted oxidoreductase